MNYKISNLLPYPDDMILASLKERIRVLHLVRFFYQSIQKAIRAFLLKEYSQFDAQVSENLCQVRALQLIEIIHNQALCNEKTFSFFYQKIKLLFKKCDATLNHHLSLSKNRPSHYSEQINKKIILEIFLEEHQVDLRFSNVMFFLLQTYILSKYKLVGEHNISHGIHYDKLCKDLNLSSKTYARKVIHRLQRNISEYSCQFIYSLAQKLKTDSHYLPLLNSLYFKDEVGRHVFSCYETTKIILQYIAKHNRPIKFIVHRITKNTKDRIVFILKPSLSQNSYELSHYLDNKLNKGMITFVGVVHYNTLFLERKERYIIRFLRVGFESIILSNMAQHPQYAGLLLEDKKHNPYVQCNANKAEPEYSKYVFQIEKQFLKHKQISKEIGCAIDNASLFLLTHVYCDTLKHQPIENLNNTSLHIAI